MDKRDNRTTAHRRIASAVALMLALAAALALSAGAPAQDLQSRIDQNRSALEQKQSELHDARAQAGVLSTTIERLDDRVDELSGQVATLRNREALVQAQLEKTEARLKRARERLVALRAHLRRSIQVLEKRLVAIYESDSPDALTVILNANGFDDLLNRYEYLNAIQSQDAQIVARVRTLRNRARNTVETVRAARDRIAAKREELARTRAQAEARESALAAAEDRQQAALQDTRAQAQELEGDVSDLQDEIAAQLQAQAEAEAQAAAPPAGPVQGTTSTGPVSSSGFIWPVSGPVTSPFCEQRAWESCHPGIDIAVPSGTPVHAAASGRVAIAAPEGGYGNYICIDHGGGLSSCYAHLQSFGVSVGQQVSQGQVIAYSDCTGLCFGPHLHFEVRVNGQPVDPMGYL